jgi:hypothetical protein
MYMRCMRQRRDWGGPALLKRRHWPIKTPCHEEARNGRAYVSWLDWIDAVMPTPKLWANICLRSDASSEAEA